LNDLVAASAVSFPLNEIVENGEPLTYNVKSITSLVSRPYDPAETLAGVGVAPSLKNGLVTLISLTETVPSLAEISPSKIGTS
jgi:hypothetical protein